MKVRTAAKIIGWTFIGVIVWSVLCLAYQLHSIMR